MAYQRIKQFWIDKINDLITACNVQPDEADWQDKINDVKVWDGFELVGLRVYKNICTKANLIVQPDDDIKGNDYGVMCGSSFKDLGAEYEELVEVMKTKIGVDPTDPTTVNKKINNVDTPYPKWKSIIEAKIYNSQGKLTDIPAGKDLTDLLYYHELYQKITNKTNGLPNLILRKLVAPNKPNKWGCNWDYKVNDVELQNYKNASGNLTARENQIRTAGGLSAADPIPNNWENDFNNVRQYFINDLGLNNPNNLPTIPAGEKLASLLIKGAEYTRINTKLNGKISDSELQALLDAIPTCPHTDYDTIKSERDTLQTENTQLKEHQCDCESKVAQKEQQIITKIITDLSLATERERENLLEAVITEIKGKLTPPTDNSKERELAAKQSKITELETEITKLKTGKPQNEVVEKITEFSKQLNLSESQISELKQANSYQALFIAQSKMVESKLNSEVQEKNHAQTLNYVLGAISLGSLLILAWMLIKRTNFIPKLGDKDKK